MKPFAVPIKGEYKVASVGQSKNELLYRGYSIHDLMRYNCSYEEVVYLILRGYLPNESQLIQYKQKLNQYTLHPKLIHFIINAIPPNTHCIDVLKLSIAYFGIIKQDISSDLDKMDEIIALLPLMLLTYSNRKYYQQSLDITHKYSTAKRFLQLNHRQKDGYNITENMIACFNKLMVLYTEHGITTSAFTARIVTSARSDIYSACCAALCAAKGSLHCGANEKALQLMINYDKNVLLNKLENKQIIEGFGHRTYMRKDLRIDPRNKYVKHLAEILSHPQHNQQYAKPKLYQNALEIEHIMMTRKNLFANIDFYGALVHYQLGIDECLLTAMICINLCVGWMANIIEQKQNRLNRLIRPISIYTGQKYKTFVALKSRL